MDIFRMSLPSSLLAFLAFLSIFISCDVLQTVVCSLTFHSHISYFAFCFTGCSLWFLSSTIFWLCLYVIPEHVASVTCSYLVCCSILRVSSPPAFCLVLPLLLHTINGHRPWISGLSIQQALHGKPCQWIGQPEHPIFKATLHQENLNLLNCS